MICASWIAAASKMAMPHNAESSRSFRVLTSVGPPTVFAASLGASMAGRSPTLTVVRIFPPRAIRRAAVLAVALVAAACASDSPTTETADGAAPAAEAPAPADETNDGDESTNAGDTAAAETDPVEADDAAWPHDFVEDLIGGGQLDANDLAGQDIVLWFWAPW